MHGHRKDANQRTIERELRAHGMSVLDVHNGPLGDLWVGYQGVNYLFEIKDAAKSPSRRRLSDKQKDDHEAWRGQIAKVETVEQILEIIYGTKGDNRE
jgi:hypothetical protein